MLTYNYEECKLDSVLPASFDLNYSQKYVSVSKTSWCSVNPGTSDGTFLKASGFISHFSTLKSEQSVFCVRSHTYCDLCIQLVTTRESLYALTSLIAHQKNLVSFDYGRTWSTSGRDESVSRVSWAFQFHFVFRKCNNAAELLNMLTAY